MWAALHPSWSFITSGNAACEIFHSERICAAPSKSHQSEIYRCSVRNPSAQHLIHMTKVKAQVLVQRDTTTFTSFRVVFAWV